MKKEFLWEDFTFFLRKLFFVKRKNRLSHMNLQNMNENYTCCIKTKEWSYKYRQ